jgi:hypothetical protein
LQLFSVSVGTGSEWCSAVTWRVKLT